MTDTIVLLHGGATGSASWNPVARALIASGASVFAPDMLGYGASPAPTSSYAIAEEVAHLTRLLRLQPRSCNGTIYAVGFGGTFHLVTHSLCSFHATPMRTGLRSGTATEPQKNRRTVEHPAKRLNTAPVGSNARTARSTDTGSRGRPVRTPTASYGSVASYVIALSQTDTSEQAS